MHSEESLGICCLIRKNLLPEHPSYTEEWRRGNVKSAKQCDSWYQICRNKTPLFFTQDFYLKCFKIIGNQGSARILRRSLVGGETGGEMEGEGKEGKDRTEMGKFALLLPVCCGPLWVWYVAR